MARDTSAERSRHRSRPLTAGIVVLVGLSAAACSSSPARKSTESPQAAVRATWTTFFSGKTPPARRLALLEHASQFSSVVKEQSTSALAKEASAKVTAVSVKANHATVRYTIDLDGAPALKGQTGSAVRLDGAWKVSSASFCALLALEQANVPACSTGS